jgi:hypothetical protein
MEVISEEKKIKKKSKPENPAAQFLICKRRKNQPQVSPQICEKRCRHRYKCPSYFDYLQPGLFDESLTKFTEPPRKEMKRRKIAREEEKSAESSSLPAPQRLF